jgi:cob(I)alamin adenosyltransferase
MMEKNGLIIVFTGPGKGKTSVALGIALRASGHGKRTVVIQFLKSQDMSGEQLVRNIPLIQVHAFGFGFFKQGDDPEPHREAAAKGWRMAEDIILSGGADILVLDEISHAINFNFLSQELIVDALKLKVKDLHVVLTGRNMPQELLEIADIATEMKEIRHMYREGKQAVEGIDF